MHSKYILSRYWEKEILNDIDGFEFLFSKIGRHFAILDTIKDSPALHRSLALKMYMAPSVSFSPLTMTPEQAIAQYNTQVNNVNTHQVISCRLRQTNVHINPSPDPLPYPHY